ncbi:hypothetical protein CEXT_402811 [Caerostris extrusa]|uniref:Uncharacterized protein n=1 Tax=Caerostris extrusa TaxID=172846 RepID=A0AAV4XPB8_CAEEX|nr:hypothetical protein CEXT_402811 [Caerostris extrusa]
MPSSPIILNIEFHLHNFQPKRVSVMSYFHVIWHFLCREDKSIAYSHDDIHSDMERILSESCREENNRENSGRDFLTVCYFKKRQQGVQTLGKNKEIKKKIPVPSLLAMTNS